MCRWISLWLVSLSLTCTMAGFASAKESKAPADKPSAAQAEQVDLDENDVFGLTRATEVILDGRPVSYDSVPDTAIILRMEVSQDRRTIVRVVFRSR